MPETVKWSLITAIVMLILATAFRMIENRINKMIDNKDKSKNSNYNKIKLVNNLFFGKMKSNIINIKRIFDKGMDSTNKDKSICNIMVNKYIIYYTYFEMYAKELDNIFDHCLEDSDENCCLLSNEILYNKTKKYYDEASLIFKRYYMIADIYTEDEKYIIKHVIEKFLYWHKDRMKDFEKYMVDTCYSTDICSKLKADNVLTYLTKAFEDTIEDAKQTLNNLNGKLTGKEFTNIDLFIDKENLYSKIFEYNNNNDVQKLIKYALNTDSDEEFVTLSKHFTDSLYALKDFSGIKIHKKESSSEEIF